MSKKKRIKFKNAYANKKINYKWMIVITIITFFVAILMGYSSLIFMEKVPLFGAIILLLLIVFMGIFFDLLGIAVTAAEETPFNSMAASRVQGAKESIMIIRNAGSVSNFFNDVIGDISGIISGTAATAIILKINEQMTIETTVGSILLGAIVAAITVGGKALGKEIALRYSNFIVYRLGFIVSLFNHRKK